MAETITINPIAPVVVNTPFTVSGSYSIIPTRSSFGYTSNGGTVQSLPTAATLTSAVGTFSFTFPGLTTPGNNTIMVELSSSGPTASVVVNALAAPILTPGSGGQILDAAGNVWTLPASGVILENGLQPAGNWSCTQLTAVKGVIYIYGLNGLWYSWTGTSWSASGTTNLPETTVTTGTAFSVKNGMIYEPNGNLYVAKGINISSSVLNSASTNNTNFPLTTLFPQGINHIRAPVYPTNPGTSTAVYPTPASFLSVVEQITGYTLNGSTWTATNPTGIVIEFEDHNQNNTTYAALPPYTGAALTIQTNWYTAMATYFNGNPYVWLGGPNEMDTPDGSYSTISALSTWESQIYNAIRAGSPNCMIQLMAGVGGSDVSTVGLGSGYVANNYATMTNICWEIHCYYTDNDVYTNNGVSYPSVYSTALEYVQGGTSAPQGGAGGGWGITGAQTIHSADGVVPVIIGEWGTDSGTYTGTGSDQIAAAIKSVQAQGIGATAWAWFPGQNNYSWGLVNDAGGPSTATLSGWGSVVAGAI